MVSSTTTITLDADSANPVKINIAGYNGAGVKTGIENDRSVGATKKEARYADSQPDLLSSES
jgi:hypothetical protein